MAIQVRTHSFSWSNSAKVAAGIAIGVTTSLLWQIGKRNRLEIKDRDPKTAQESPDEILQSAINMLKTVEEIKKAEETKLIQTIEQLSLQLGAANQELSTTKARLQKARSELDEKHAGNLDSLVRIWQRKVDQIFSQTAANPRSPTIEELQTIQQDLFALWYRQHELSMRNLRALCVGKLPPDTTPIPPLESLRRDYLVFGQPTPSDPPSVSGVFVESFK